MRTGGTGVGGWLVAFTLCACAPAEPTTTSEAGGGSSTTASVDPSVGQLPTFGSTSAGESAGETATEEPPASAGDVVVHLFEWSWADVARECEDVLGPAGVAGVQVSPPNEYRLIDPHPWWERYQPVSYTIVGRSGDAEEFADMVERCAAVGVEIYVDAVLNHMAWAKAGPGNQQVGVGGTVYERYSFPGLYEEEHFHDCKQGIQDWSSRWEVHFCELATLPDLATEHPPVRARLAGYLEQLMTLGVAGFRIDAAKHVPAEDLEAIFGMLSRAPFVFHEVIPGDAIAGSEYFGTGRVTEFRFGLALSQTLRAEQLAQLPGFEKRWGLHPSDRALVFIDNHDNQRGHGYGEPLTHEDGALYRVALALMLALPYGRPKLMSSYAIDDTEAGPPKAQDGGILTPHGEGGACVAPWICEHRWTSTRGMIGFRNATQAAPAIERWWDNGNDQIAFARGELGYLVVNREELPTLTRAFETGLPEGTYCDVYAGGRSPDGRGCVGATVEVGAAGQAEITVGPLSAVAIHVGARLP